METKQMTKDEIIENLIAVCKKSQQLVGACAEEGFVDDESLMELFKHNGTIYRTLREIEENEFSGNENVQILEYQVSHGEEFGFYSPGDKVDVEVVRWDVDRPEYCLAFSRGSEKDNTIGCFFFARFDKDNEVLRKTDRDFINVENP